MLFLCTGNSCRSQMAEGWAHHLLGDCIEPHSAGIEAHGMNANAVRVMQETGVDITGQSSKLASSLADVPLDLVISVGLGIYVNRVQRQQARSGFRPLISSFQS
ncbi:MAG TPA: arsenate reductase ArsC [Pirellulaceae bacterium]|nr:arsenate reductase ArsC [Pirellulaceae bacterium]